jgi:hypothetical protein
LAKEVQRYLEDDAIEARPPSKAYCLRKFCRHNKLAFLTTSAVALAFIELNCPSLIRELDLQSLSLGTRPSQIHGDDHDLIARDKVICHESTI